MIISLIKYIKVYIHKTLVKCKLEMECLTLEIGSNWSNFT